MEKARLSEKLREFIHPLMLKAISSRRQFRLEVMGEIPENQQFIFVANHYGIDDFPTVGEVIGRHVYVLVSDVDRKTASGLALSLNGVVWTNRLNPESRKQAKEELIRHLHLGRSIVMFPEGTWNLSPNLLMLPMYFGCISISQETGVPILPVYLHFTEEVCKAEINPPFYPGEDKVAAIRDLRDILASSAWRFLEQEPMLSRADLNMNMWEENIQGRYQKYDRGRKDPEGVRRYESALIFRPKGQSAPEEVFTHLDELIPCWENAFLFRER